MRAVRVRVEYTYHHLPYGTESDTRCVGKAILVAATRVNLTSNLPIDRRRCRR
jgi:hypothetical protein